MEFKYYVNVSYSKVFSNTSLKVLTWSAMLTSLRPDKLAMWSDINLNITCSGYKSNFNFVTDFNRL